MMIDGALNSTSLMKRTTVLKRELRPYSERYVPANTPIGEPIKIPSNVIMALPYSALSKPPSLPGGGVIWVNTWRDMPAKPCEMSVHRIAARHARPVMVATNDSARNAPFLPLRKARRFMGYIAIRRSSRRNIACAAAITVNVMMNNRSPSAINEEVYRSPTASVNSLAMDEEIVVPGANKDELTRCALPMTKVTAMVSPSARPNPSMIPPTIPTRECGTTTFQMTSQVVAPNP